MAETTSKSVTGLKPRFGRYGGKDIWGQEFSEEIRKEFLKRKIFIKQLTNIKENDDFTEVTGLVENYWELRYIDPRKLSMQFEIMIYNNVVALYDYKTKNDIFCVEIYNDRLAAMQKQMFDFIWDNAKKMKIVSPHGAARLA